jgi:nitrogen regulatory protein P-II 1
MNTNYTLMTIITRREKLEAIKSRLIALGIDGMSVMLVEGNGQQKGQIEYEEDGKRSIMLIPKVMVELVLTSISAKTVMDAVIPILQTGIIGDGKIFIQYLTGQIITVRTGEETISNNQVLPKEVIDMDTPAIKPMTKITIITRKEKFDELRKELVGIGITGMTVTQVDGCGKQHGLSKIVEGVIKRSFLLSKIKVEIVVCAVPVQVVIDIARKVLNTGNIGDGKIFTAPIDHVVRIRTGEIDSEAL